MAVTDAFFIGNTAYVTAIVVASPQGELDGNVWSFAFTDNSGTYEPDEISILGEFDGVPIASGNLTVSD